MSGNVGVEKPGAGLPPDPSGFGSFVEQVQDEVFALAERVGTRRVTLDITFLAYLLRSSRFGFFTFGPVTLDVNLIEDIVYRTTARVDTGGRWEMSDDTARFATTLTREARRSGRRRIDELTYLLAFMRTNEGLPARVFSELGVTAEEVEAFARSRQASTGGRGSTAGEKLYSPEEAAEHLGVHVQTVRSWIRAGRLPASRLAGQRALRIRESDLESVLEPVDPSAID
jgi:excisionase family DNA binding protein